MTSMRRALSGLLAAALATSVMALSGPGANAGAAGPRLVLRRTSAEMTVTRREGRPFSFNPGVYLASMDAAFSLEIGREDYDSPFHVDQAMPGGGTRSLPDSLLELTNTREWTTPACWSCLLNSRHCSRFIESFISFL